GGATYACAAGGFKTGASCTGAGSADTLSCATCAGACSAGTFESTACTQSTDRVCSSCSGVANCVTGVNCTSSANSQCARCSGGFYLVSGVASTCAACSGSNCGAETYFDV